MRKNSIHVCMLRGIGHRIGQIHQHKFFISLRIATATWPVPFFSKKNTSPFESVDFFGPFCEIIKRKTIMKSHTNDIVS